MPALPSEVPSEEELPARLAADLDGAFEALVRVYGDRLFAFALRLTGSRPDAEEIAQDAFVRAHRALAGYPPERVQALALRPWLYRIALNLARNRARGHRPRMVPLDAAEGDGPALDPPEDEARGPEASAERRERGEELAALVADLPARYRAAVVLRHVMGLSYAEAAETLGQPVGTVKANVHRGVRRLRAALADEVGVDVGVGVRAGKDGSDGTR